MSTAGSLTDILLREGLCFSGISDKEVTILPVGDLGARLSALQRKYGPDRICFFRSHSI